MIGLACIIIFIISVIFSISYVYVFGNVKAKLKDKVRDCVVESVKSIDGDKLDKIIKNASKDRDEYSELLNSMLLFKAGKDVKNFYIFTKQDDNTALFFIDASPEPAEFLEKYDMESEMLAAFNGIVSVPNKASTDKWGTYLSAYSPIKNSTGQIIAIVGADSDVSVFQYIRDLFLKILIAAIGITFCVSILITFMFSRKLKRGISSIKNNLDKMGHGNLTESIDIKAKDEIEGIGYLLKQQSKISY